MGVEIVEFFGRNPQLEDGIAAGLLDRIAHEEFRLDSKRVA